MNALANHGYLPRNGRSVTAGQVDKAFQETLNIASGTLKSVIDAGVSTGTRGDGTFDLEDTVKHDVLEHDASFSRNDAAIGDALHFDPNIWNRTLTHFKSDTITINCVAAARLDRIATAQVLNPNFKLTPGGLTATFINHSLWLMTFGNRVKGNANKQFLRVIFGKWHQTSLNWMAFSDWHKINRARTSAFQGRICETIGDSNRQGSHEHGWEIASSHCQTWAFSASQTSKMPELLVWVYLRGLPD